ncbi:uncharacterized protein LOC110878374 isoform X3 [Helianthus annuus]|uniref:uncharacterized protein LOC110878374 isoform X3 n=1 Tax=Helianthus annuus TaxID=4232 RepID=UPI00165303B4|nr:uncharacterized protein LOC110878374 isoform X3 [Helianthus annuus]
MYSSAGTISLRSVCSSFHCCSRMHQLQGFWECYAPPMVKLDQKKRIQCVRVRDDQEHSVKTILDLLKHSARYCVNATITDDNSLSNIVFFDQFGD